MTNETESVETNPTAEAPESQSPRSRRATLEAERDEVAFALARSLASTAVVLFAVLGFAMLFWEITHSEGLPAATLQGELARGEQAFRQAGCWQCHHPNLKGQRWAGGFGVQRSHTWWVGYLSKPRVMHRYATKQAARRLLSKQSSGRFQLNDDGRALVAYVRYLREMGMGGATAPRFAKKTDPKALQATAYIANVKGLRRGANLAASSHDPVEGKALYRRYCLKCHGTNGRGDGPLARLLPSKPHDLASTTTYQCRSSNAALPHDIRRTIRKGTGGCGVIPLQQVLTQPQLDNLVDTVRQIAMMQGGRNARRLSWPKRQLPNRGLTMDRTFQKWLNDWWKARYHEWKAKFTRTSGKKLRYREVETWRTWIEWQGFNVWVQQNPQSVHSSRGDWKVALQRQGVFPKLARQWRKKSIKKPFLEWAKAQLKKELHKELAKEYDSFDASDRNKMQNALRRAKPKDRKALKAKLRRQMVSVGEKDRLLAIKRLSWYQLFRRVKLWTSWYKDEWIEKRIKSRWSDYLRRKGFTKYSAWREREEQSEYRHWRNEQQKLLYMAWKGQVAFGELGCQQCHTGGIKTHAAPLPRKRVHLRNYKTLDVTFASGVRAAAAKTDKKKQKKRVRPMLARPLRGVRLGGTILKPLTKSIKSRANNARRRAKAARARLPKAKPRKQPARRVKKAAKPRPKTRRYPRKRRAAVAKRGGKKTPVKVTGQARKKAAKKAPKIDLAKTGLSCGSGADEIFRSLVVGVGTKMPGLTPAQLRKYLGATHLSSLRGRTGYFAPRDSRKLWEVVAYVQFMTLELPILKALPKPTK